MIPKKIRIAKLSSGKTRQLRLARTKSGFQHFITQIHHEVKQQAVRVHPTFTEVSKLWNQLDTPARLPYEQQAAADKNQAILEYNLEHPVVKEVVTLEMAADLAEAVAALPLLPTTGYHLYLQHVSRSSETPIAFGDGVRAASARWKAMPADEKQPFLDAAIKGRQAWLDQRKSLNERLKAAGHAVIPLKDPKLRRAPSPANLYVKEHFVPYSKQHPTETLQVVMRDVLLAYHALPEEQKASYIQVGGRCTHAQMP